VKSQTSKAFAKLRIDPALRTATRADDDAITSEGGAR